MNIKHNRKTGWFQYPVYVSVHRPDISNPGVCTVFYRIFQIMDGSGTKPPARPVSHSDPFKIKDHIVVFVSQKV